MAARRLETLSRHLNPDSGNVDDGGLVFAVNCKGTSAAVDPAESVTITNNRTGKEIRTPIEHGVAIRATSLKEIGLMSYDPGFLNTAVCRSGVSYIDGDAGILRYRGYNIEELAEKSSFVEVAYLLINGELPDREQLREWNSKIMGHTYLHENMLQILKSFRYDAHPMGIVVSSLAAMNTFYPLANPALQGQNLYVNNEEIRNKQIYRIIGKLPTIAACAYRNRIGRSFTSPNSKLGYAENFLQMLDKLSEVDYRPNPKLARALDVLFILHAEHELNCSTAAVRHIASSRVDPFTCVAGAAGALYGPLHGGANEAVVNQLREIGSKDKVPQFIQDVKNRKRLMFGFGHRIYKNYDPRAKIIKKVAEEVFEIMGTSPLMEVAVALEKAALEDEYFISRKLYPNVDFYSGVIYACMGFPSDMFPVLFAIPRAVGWLAHWIEQLDDDENHIARPRQIYTGPEERPYVPIELRKAAKVRTTKSYVSSTSRRREAGTDGGQPVAKSE
eukprot:ANDGO_00499.mRNA.1 Citrate synthase